MILYVDEGWSAGLPVRDGREVLAANWPAKKQQRNDLRKKVLIHVPAFPLHNKRHLGRSGERSVQGKGAVNSISNAL